MVFMPNDDAVEAECKKIYEEVLAAEGLTLLGWRAVPVDHAVVGRFAKATQPRIWQLAVQGPQGLVGDDLERELFIVRKQVEKARAGRLPADMAFDFYTCSLSTRTIVYKVWFWGAGVGRWGAAHMLHASLATAGTSTSTSKHTFASHAPHIPPGHAPFRGARRLLQGSAGPSV
jgi:glutamate synthase domain-containing protein 1